MEGLEIEKKARVDFDKLYVKLKKLYKLNKIKKYDYYFLNNENKEVRVRKENNQIIITTKIREVINGYEVNTEKEILSSSSLYSVIDFYKQLGFKEFFRKEKEGYITVTDDLIIELLKVNNVGFLEIEATKNCKDPYNKINEQFKNLGIKKEDFETLNYYQLFKE